jgi:hypothetical protein
MRVLSGSVNTLPVLSVLVAGKAGTGVRSATVIVAAINQVLHDQASGG